MALVSDCAPYIKLSYPVWHTVERQSLTGNFPCSELDL